MRLLNMFLIIFALLSSFDSRSFSSSERTSSSFDEACFVDFRIGLLVGKSEIDIGNPKYCGFQVNRKAFLSLLNPMPYSTFYMKDNVRAKVDFSNGDIYYIDYNGVVRFGKYKFLIDKVRFTRLIQGRVH